MRLDHLKSVGPSKWLRLRGDDGRSATPALPRQFLIGAETGNAGGVELKGFEVGKPNTDAARTQSCFKNQNNIQI
jgi:hypothetical protein